MESGLYIFSEAEDFLKFMEELQAAYLEQEEGAVK